MKKGRMRLPNGFGGVSKLHGNRRNPWLARKTVGWEIVSLLIEDIDFKPLSRLFVTIVLLSYRCLQDYQCIFFLKSSHVAAPSIDAGQALPVTS